MQARGATVCLPPLITRGGEGLEDKRGGALFYCSDIQAKFGARGYPREASWVLGLPSTISTPIDQERVDSIGFGELKV